MPLPKAEIARLRALREKKHREAARLFVVEGEKVVGELLAAGFPFLEVYATEEWLGRAASPFAAGRRGAESAPYPDPIAISDSEMARLSHFPTPATILAIGRIERRPLAPGDLDRGLTLALDGIQDPGNVGTLLRVADWFALDRVVLSPDCADLFSQKVINASMGSFARVAVHTTELADALADAKAPILGCDLQGEDVHSLAPCRDAVVVIGREGRGLSPAVQARVTRRVTIPRFGGAESLNAAIAAAVVCDNLRRTSG
ncbi:MAG TPA: RNA methyltransferase [Lacunisphaera sp.]|nr:RNA methyltransferase [Lacunisphaera sp.]